jgi:NitT/TauT family transport system permease protein
MNAFVTTLIGPVVAVSLWFLVVFFAVVDEILLPSPIETFNSFVELFSSQEIVSDLWATTYRVTIAFGIAVSIGLPLGLILGSSKKLYHSLEFLIDFFRSMPATAIFPIFLLVFGVNDASKIAVAVFASVLVIIFNTAHGIMNASKVRTLVATVMGASRFKMFKAILFWESLPQTFVGFRVALNFCLIIIVVTEMFIGTNAGLGRRIVDFQIIYKTDFMYAVVILTGVLGYLLNVILALLQRKVIHWTH